MSYSMSPPAQKPPQAVPRPYSPYGNAGSPPNQSPYGPPPPKRQRMSPDPRSPPTNGAPPHAYPQGQPHGLPNTGAYGNPYAQQQAHSPYGTPGGYVQSPQSSFNTPQPYPFQQPPWQSQTPTPAPAYSPRQASPPNQQSREMMPPPPRPNKDEREEKVGVEEIGDSLFGSGINLKDEENYMHTIYSNRQNDSFSTNQNTSFGSSTMSPNNSFNLLTQGTSFGSQDAQNAAFAGTMGQTMSQEDIEVESRRKREAAARNLAERRQHHLNHQFLQCNNVRKRMDRLAINNGVALNVSGVWVKQPETKPETNVMMNGAGTNGVSEVVEKTGYNAEPKAESLVNQGSPFESVVSLISLAAGERLRGLLDEAHTLARARKYGDHGRVVPPEFSDIAEGEGKQQSEEVVPESTTDSQWDKVPETQEAETGNNSGSKSATPKPEQTVSFQGLLNNHLRTLAERDRAAENARLAKREKRKRAAEAATNGDSATTPAETSAEADAAAPAETAAPVKMSKKEAARQAKEKSSSTEAQAHSTTNQTAAMMALGKKGSRYSWMTGGASSMPTNRFAKPSTGTSGTATPAQKPDSGPTTPGGTAMARGGSGVGAEPKVPEWGDFREGKEGGLQLRDWIFVLERDGREKLALERAMGALGRGEEKK